ncbi:tetratricopeptide repeat protein [Pseudoroseicyclus aestuarii]|uniref:Flp pilus assembly protein TadD n=1 Tax=Pseudoroseicyclus aestuarii TaxID=1795041 RepID=A0A318SYZ2_9RHOB|nr:tetratricopeptide repeat protein [Pseudoroseicyclus aestuarii]PYE84977.1 Flp pilus assembly protein TadD [Pseudoroseicyclus aestuarii]
MRHPFALPLCLALALGLGACSRSPDRQVEAALGELNVIDESGLNEVMLGASDPADAVAYFQRATAGAPDRIDLQRGLGKALIRAGRPAEAVGIWQGITARPEATDEDRVALAGALIRTNSWTQAEAVLNAIPPTYETYERYRLEAIVADANSDWARADSFYEVAAGLTTTPASVLNNWGYSKLTRGAYGDAQRLFTEALRHEPGLFTAKNNLVLARGAQRQYDLPVIPMSQTERAQLLYTLALTAIKQGDVSIGRSLLEDAVTTHPRHFEEAARALDALQGGAAAL